MRASERQHLSEQIRTIGGILIPGGGPVEDLLGTIEEMHRTYSGVSAAIGRFVAPEAREGKVDLQPCLAMKRGELATLIRNNRGHRTRIVEYYVRVGGLRDWLQPRVHAGEPEIARRRLRRAWQRIRRFVRGLTRIGDAMTGEASAIAGLLPGGQEQMARQSILKSRQKLVPVECRLFESMHALQHIEARLRASPANACRGQVQEKANAQSTTADPQRIGRWELTEVDRGVETLRRRVLAVSRLGDALGMLPPALLDTSASPAPYRGPAR